MTQPTFTGLSVPVRISYGIMLALLILIGWLHLATLVLTALFGFFVIRALSRGVGGRKWLAVTLYVLLVTGFFIGLVYFSKQAYVALPKLATTTIPAVVEYAEKQGMDLPFTDYASLKTVALTGVREKLANVGLYLRGAMFEIASFIVGLVLPVSLFLTSEFQAADDPRTVKSSLYYLVSRELGLRFRTFYRSFATVIGAQIVISTINTGLTSVFLVWNGFPYATVIIMFTFLCGLLPIIGNLISNTLIIAVAFTISPRIALFALIFLMTIHKFEYFLNSKIIGDRIQNPMWLTLIGLVVGERLMGVPGMIFAPVVLHYVKVEASRARVAAGAIGFDHEPADVDEGG